MVRTNFGAMRCHLLLALLAASLLAPRAGRASDGVELGFTPLCDGKTFNGWKRAEESPNTWTIQDGAFVAHGARCHLFYVGDPKPFKDFDLKVDVMTKPGSNGGIYFDTKYQAQGWPKTGIECQVNNTHSDWIRTGSLYGLVNIARSPAQDNKWWTQEIIVRGRTVTVLVDGRRIFEYREPPGVEAEKNFGRKLCGGTFALQGHDPNSTVYYKNIRVKRLDK